MLLRRLAVLDSRPLSYWKALGPSLKAFLRRTRVAKRDLFCKYAHCLERSHRRSSALSIAFITLQPHRYSVASDISAQQLLFMYLILERRNKTPRHCFEGRGGVISVLPSFLCLVAFRKRAREQTKPGYQIHAEKMFPA